jgi:putative PIN family toxin of toxin-antitoxin system
MLTVVLDVNVIVSAVMSGRGTPRRILDAWRQRRFTVVMAEGIIAEVSAKLLDPAIGGRLGVTSGDVQAVIALLRTEAEHAQPLDRPAVTGDPEDDYVLATAAQAHADYLVTGDKGLLRLGSHAGFRIISPRDFYALLPSAS